MLIYSVTLYNNLNFWKDYEFHKDLLCHHKY